MSYEIDKQFSDEMFSVVRNLLAPHGMSLIPTDGELDTHEAIDGLLLCNLEGFDKAAAITAAFRARRFKGDRFLHYFTLRFSRNGMPTEWDKILHKGRVQKYIYVTAKRDHSLMAFFVIDCDQLRLLHTAGKLRWEDPQQHEDGTVSRSLDLRLPEHQELIDVSMFHYSGSLRFRTRRGSPKSCSSKIKYFLSGASGIRASVLPEVAAHVDYRLLSMHATFKGNTRVWCEIAHHPKCAMKEVMLDSGAYTAFTKGHKLKLEDLIATYDDVMRRLPKHMQVWLINLDVIPGEFGRVSTPEEIEKALDESDKNYRILKKRYGSRVLPVYHQTEGIERLRQVIKQNDYIGLGFRQDFAEHDRIKYAEEVLREINGQVRTHGLATTGYKMLARTSFDSVDSATWLYSAAMGGVLVINDAGELQNIKISSSSPTQRDLRAHFLSLSEDEQALVLARLSEAGVALEQAQNDLSYRILMNAHEMREWLSAYSPPAEIATEGSLFPI